MATSADDPSAGMAAPAAADSPFPAPSTQRRRLLSLFGGAAAGAVGLAATREADAAVWQPLLGDYALRSEAVANVGIQQPHYNQGGSLPGLGNIVTRVDGTQYWSYLTYSTNCNCLCDCCCFLAGTRVLMADGSERPIESIRVGDRVMGISGPVSVISVTHPRLGPRQMLKFADDSLTWAESHSFWTRDRQGMEWWWNGNPAIWQREITLGSIRGLPDNSTMRTGPGFEYAHVTGWKRASVVVNPGFTPDTPLYFIKTDGCHSLIVNGYAVGGGVDGFSVDYSTLSWARPYV